MAPTFSCILGLKGGLIPMPCDFSNMKKFHNVLLQAMCDV